jgi:hypothetical protein
MIGSGGCPVDGHHLGAAVSERMRLADSLQAVRYVPTRTLSASMVT